MSGNGFAVTSRRIRSEKILRKLGTAQIRLEQLDFPHSKRLDPKNVERLKSLFRGERGCWPEDVHNRIPAIIEEAQLQAFLDHTGIPVSALASDGPDHPKLDLPTGFRLECLRGQHRVSAAHDVLASNEKRWVVDLFASDITQEAKSDLIEEYGNERTPDDGEFYCKIRQYQGIFGRQNPYFERRWWARLASSRTSSNKRMRLEQLFKHVKFAPAFDAFRHLRALYVGLRISVLSKMISMGCTEELLMALESLKTFWYDVFDNDENAMERLDCDTILAVQNKAPGACSREADHLRELARTGQIFRDFSEQERLALWTRLCRATTSCLVPSLYAFFENLKYIQVAADSMKRLVRLGSRETLRSALESAFSEDSLEDGVCQIQVSPASARLVTSRGADHFDLSYRQLWLYALREYPDMPAEKKQKLAGHRGAKANERVLYCFASLAYSLGFRSLEIEKLRQQNPDREMARNLLTTARRPEEYEFDDLEARITQVADAISAAQPMQGPQVTHEFDVDEHSSVPNRCGLPRSSDQPRDKAQMFLAALHGSVGDQHPTVTSFFIQRSIYFSFLGRNISVDIDEIKNTPSVELHQLGSLGGNLPRFGQLSEEASQHQQNEGRRHASRSTAEEEEQQTRLRCLRQQVQQEEARLSSLASEVQEGQAQSEQLQAALADYGSKLVFAQDQERELLARLEGLVRETEKQERHERTEEQQGRAGGLAAAEAMQRRTLEQLAAKEREKRASLEHLEAKERRLQARVDEIESNTHRLSGQERNLQETVDKNAATLRHMETLISHAAESEKQEQARLDHLESRVRERQDVLSALEMKEQEQRQRIQQNEEGFTGGGNRLPSEERAFHGSPSDASDGQSNLRITFEELRDGVWVSAHEMLVDPADPSEVKQLATTYMRKGFALMSTEDRALWPEICFEVATSDGTNTIRVAREWGIKTADTLPEAYRSRKRKRSV